MRIDVDENLGRAAELPRLTLVREFSWGRALAGPIEPPLKNRYPYVLVFQDRTDPGGVVNRWNGFLTERELEDARRQVLGYGDGGASAAPVPVAPTPPQPAAPASHTFLELDD